MAGARFNPPPGWPVPQDWMPPEDWVPDPTWPAAPPDWQFFVDDEPTRRADTMHPEWYPSVESSGQGVGEQWVGEVPYQSGAALRSRSTLVAVVAGCVVGVLAVLAGLLIVRHFHGRSPAESVAAEPSQPTAAWTSAPAATAPPSGSSGGARPPGDLGLRTPISSPECDGQGIVVLGSLIEPSRYAIGVQELLDAHPGAAYLRTDLSCHSLRQRTGQGNEIYAVYLLAGHTQEQLCAAVRAAGGKSYGKWLDNTTDPDYIVPC